MATNWALAKGRAEPCLHLRRWQKTTKEQRSGIYSLQKESWSLTTVRQLLGWVEILAVITHVPQARRGGSRALYFVAQLQILHGY